MQVCFPTASTKMLSIVIVDMVKQRSNLTFSKIYILVVVVEVDVVLVVGVA